MLPERSGSDPDPIAPLLYAEDAVVAAMLSADIDTLDALTADDAVICTPGGAPISKSQDLAAYREGTIQYQRLRVLARSSAARGPIGQTKMLAAARLAAQEESVDLIIEWERRWEHRAGRWQLTAISARATA